MVEMTSFQHTFELVSKFQTFSLVMTLTPVCYSSHKCFVLSLKGAFVLLHKSIMFRMNRLQEMIRTEKEGELLVVSIFSNVIMVTGLVWLIAHNVFSTAYTWFKSWDCGWLSATATHDNPPHMVYLGSIVQQVLHVSPSSPKQTVCTVWLAVDSYHNSLESMARHYKVNVYGQTAEE